jgi:hypothetical protein
MMLNSKYVALFGVLLISVAAIGCGKSDRDERGQALEPTPSGRVGLWGGSIPFDSIGKSLGTDESERSDRLTGGRVEKGQLIAGDRRIWITIDIPAFRLTLWQNGRDVRTYQIGIGRRSYPLPSGERKATEIIWNPEWVQPDSSWVEETEDVEVGERIEADDLRNPLGKIKIPLGGAILIHQAASPSDIGRLVSHGCARMLTEDIFDLTEKIVSARGMPVTREQIEHAKMSTDRLAAKLDPPIWVDINYDTHVVEGGVLYLFPDVYNRSINPREALRLELMSNGVDAASIDDGILEQMLERVTMTEMFSVSIADIKAGRALTAGWTKPLTGWNRQD